MTNNLFTIPFSIPDEDLDYWIRTGIGEARGEHEFGKIAVMQVVVNRVKANSWWGKTIKDVCLFPYQFSCWNQDNPNRPVILSIQPDDKIYLTFDSIARRIMSGELMDNTFGCCHYKTKKHPWPKDWGEFKNPIGIIDNHAFYRGIK